MKRNKNFSFEIEENKECETLADFTKWGHYIGKIDNLINKNQIIKNINEKGDLTTIKVSYQETFKSLFQKDLGNKDFSEDEYPSYPECRSFLNTKETLYNVMKYTNPTPLILDSIKLIFYMSRSDYIIGEINKEKYLFYKNRYEVPLSEYLKHNDKDNVLSAVQRIFVFNWIMCVKNGLCLSYENNIYIKSINPFVTNTLECRSCLQCFSINEHNYQTNMEKSISPTILSRWFDGKVETFYELAKQMLEGTDVDIFRDRFKKVIQFYEPDFIPWVNSVYDRINFAKNY